MLSRSSGTGLDRYSIGNTHNLKNPEVNAHDFTAQTGQKTEETLPFLQPIRLDQRWFSNFMSDFLIGGKGYRTFNLVGTLHRETFRTELDYLAYVRPSYSGFPTGHSGADKPKKGMRFTI